MALVVAAWTTRPFGVGPASVAVGRPANLGTDNPTGFVASHPKAVLYGKNHAEEALLPGLYHVDAPAGLPVSEAFEVASTTTGKLQPGQTFEVSKIADYLDSGYLRARVCFPCKGWVSLQHFSAVNGRIDLVQRLEASRQSPTTASWCSESEETEAPEGWSSCSPGSLQHKGASLRSFLPSTSSSPGVTSGGQKNSEVLEATDGVAPFGVPSPCPESLSPAFRTGSPAGSVHKCTTGPQVPASRGRVIVVSRGKPLSSAHN